MCDHSNINCFSYKKIHDPVHGTIGISQIELNIINTKSFQRLRNIKQLGLANFVFPGADYTRFSHSIGVCHLSGKIYDAIHYAKNDHNINEKQKYRLAGLLHDVGHYPFSHTTESAIKRFLDNEEPNIEILRRKDEAPRVEDQEVVTDKPRKIFSHESVGREIVTNDKEIKTILEDSSYDPYEICNLFTRNSETKDPEKNMISSDLDADRLDYLLRSSYSIGLPYGSTDLDYILRQIKTDTDSNICVSPKALRTIDHFLLCRYFDYSQVVYHKTVAGFEEVLKEVIIFLLKKGKIIYKEEEIQNSISTGQWCRFDDVYVMNQIRDFITTDGVDNNTKKFIESILFRIPPREIVKFEYLETKDQKGRTDFKAKVSDLNLQIKSLSEYFDISKDLFFVWDNHMLEFTKSSKSIGITKSCHMDDEDIDKIDQSARIFDRINQKSTPIMERNDSLMSILSNYALFSTRLFVLLDRTEENNQKFDKMRNKIKENLPYRDWK